MALRSSLPSKLLGRVKITIHFQNKLLKTGFITRFMEYINIYLENIIIKDFNDVNKYLGKCLFKKLFEFQHPEVPLYLTS